MQRGYADLFLNENVEGRRAASSFISYRDDDGHHSGRYHVFICPYMVAPFRFPREERGKEPISC